MSGANQDAPYRNFTDTGPAPARSASAQAAAAAGGRRPGGRPHSEKAHFRLMSGGELDDSLVVQVADAVMEAFAIRR